MADGSHAKVPAYWRWLVCTPAGFAALPAHAFLLQGEALDAVASWLALVVLIVVPIVGITAFWLVHILPEKIAHKRHHPQTDAIHMLCILSLFFGGLLWPLAFLWAYSKPVLYKLAYGTDKHEDYVADKTAVASIAPVSTENEVVRADLLRLRASVERALANGGTPQELAGIRDQLAAIESRIAAQPPVLAQAQETR